MAFLMNIDTEQRCFLHAHHSFGRLADAVDTVVDLPAVSKHHAIIEWQDNGWTIRDLSLNGCWVNRTKLTVNCPQPLKVGDTLYFANPRHGMFEVKDISPPCDLLIPLSNNTRPAERLSSYHLLPDEINPQVVLFMDQNKGQWSFSKVDQPAIKPQLLSENDVIEFDRQAWQLKLSRLALDTEMVQTPKRSFDDLDFIFNLSADEEEVRLWLQMPTRKLDLAIRSHHYLTLILARHRAADAQKGFEPQQQGWVYPEQLAKDLGIEMNHLNIQVHRARKQFSDILLNQYDAQQLIERQSGRVRFGGGLFSIYKDQQLECQLQGKNHGGR